MKISSKPPSFVLEGTDEDFRLSGFESPCNEDPTFTMIRSFFFLIDPCNRYLGTDLIRLGYI